MIEGLFPAAEGQARAGFQYTVGPQDKGAFVFSSAVKMRNWPPPDFNFSNSVKRSAVCIPRTFRFYMTTNGDISSKTLPQCG